LPKCSHQKEPKMSLRTVEQDLNDNHKRKISNRYVKSIMDDVEKFAKYLRKELVLYSPG
jgi:hypothetical protein